MTLNRNIPTGFNTLDIILGENERDLQGNLTNVRRGIPLGEQGVISAVQAAGKTTLTIDATSYAIHAGYPCHKIIIFDTDGGVYKENRLVKLTKMAPEMVRKYYQVYETNIIEDIISILEKEHEEYMDMKYKPVEFFDPIRQEKIKMKPYVIVIFDTVTSMKSAAYDVDGKSSMIANETDLTGYRFIANLVNSMTNFFDKNSAAIWLSHLKDNNPKIGATVAEKDFKSTQNNKKAAIPTRLKFKASWALWLNSINDGANQESSSHPIKEYSLEDAEANSAYTVGYVAAKSRTGTEGRTKGTLVFMNGEFNRNASLVVDCKNLGVFKQAGTYPTGENPSVFKGQDDCDEEISVMGMKRKTGLTVEGYDRTTNILEARLLLNYIGDNETILGYQSQLYGALVNSLENKLSYELEANCVTQEDLDNSSKKLNRMFAYMSKIKRQSTIDMSKPIEKPEIVEDVDIL